MSGAAEASARRNGARPEPLGVVGAGWVGLVSAACFADLGHEVVVRDVVPERISDLAAGHVPIYEPGLASLLERNVKRLHFTLDIGDVFARAKTVFVCVGTPSTPSGDADLSAVWRLLDEIPPLEGRTILVMKSTVPVGTGAAVRAALDARGLASIGYVSNPEFLAEGSAVSDFVNPDRIVIGASEEQDAKRVARIYSRLAAPIVRTDVASAEMTKLASNAFLATRISFVNEIANVCEATGADVDDVARGMGLDRRLGPYFLRAGIGYGGSCFPKDVKALKQLAGNAGYHFQLLSAVIDVNELQKRRVVQKLAAGLGGLRGKTIALLGLAFKPNTNDMREASSVVIASRLLAEGATVKAWDPVAMEEASRVLPQVTMAESVLDAVADADAAVIVTEWDELRDVASPEVLQAMRGSLIVDGRNVLDPERARAVGFVYESIGRPSHPARTGVRTAGNFAGASSQPRALASIPHQPVP